MGGGGTDPAEHTRAKMKTNIALPNFPLRPSLLPMAQTGLLIIHNTTSKPHLLCSLTKKYFHLKQIESQNKTAKVTK